MGGLAIEPKKTDLNMRGDKRSKGERPWEVIKKEGVTRWDYTPITDEMQP